MIVNNKSIKIMFWEKPPSTLSINKNTVHLWQGDLQVSQAEVQNFADLLSADEITKANRFHFEHHRRRYIVARGMLRKVLGQYLKIEPHQIQFQYSEKGKPCLVMPNNSQSLEFNLSHSEEMALYGVSLMRRVGVDIEKIRSITDADAIAKRFFTPKEGALIKALEGEAKIKTFFQLWTAKEAYLKAIGVGIGGGLDQVEIQWNNGTVEGIHPHDPSKALDSSWGLVSFPLAENYIGAIAIEEKEYKLKGFIADFF